MPLASPPDGGVARDRALCDVARRLSPEELFHCLVDLRRTSHAADKNDFVDLPDRDTCVLQGSLARIHGAGDQIVHQALEFRPGQLDQQVLGPGRVSGDEREVDLGFFRVRKLDLCLLGGFLQSLQGQLVGAQVDALFAFELGREIVNQPDVEILATQEVSPLVLLTSKTPSAMTSTDTSNVPPLRS